MKKMQFKSTYGFYPIVDDYHWLERLLPQGVKTIQLRIKDMSDAQLREQIRQSIEYAKAFDCQLIINDYWEMALEYGAEYLHLGQEDLDVADIKAIQNSGAKLGVSTHSLEELDRALSLDPDYIALGPIYETTLKKMKWDPQGLEKISQWKSKISCPLIAIGGITFERAGDVLKAGADSIAVVSDVLYHQHPEMRARQWLGLFENR